MEIIEEQQDYVNWRSAPVEERAAHGRQIIIRYHPDKCAYLFNLACPSCAFCLIAFRFYGRWDQYNPICDHDHKEGWADHIFSTIAELMESDKEALRNLRERQRGIKDQK